MLPLLRRGEVKARRLARPFPFEGRGEGAMREERPREWREREKLRVREAVRRRRRWVKRRERRVVVSG